MTSNILKRYLWWVFSWRVSLKYTISILCMPLYDGQLTDLISRKIVVWDECVFPEWLRSAEVETVSLLQIFSGLLWCWLCGGHRNMFMSKEQLPQQYFALQHSADNVLSHIFISFSLRQSERSYSISDLISGKFFSGHWEVTPNVTDPKNTDAVTCSDDKVSVLHIYLITRIWQL